MVALKLSRETTLKINLKQALTMIKLDNRAKGFFNDLATINKDPHMTSLNVKAAIIKVQVEQPGPEP
uniref:Uncharacterized protein n=1 Tax=Romanomermis culicivorax TaxID=13658 RepID=A0A915JN71_ROMCU